MIPLLSVAVVPAAVADDEEADLSPPSPPLVIIGDTILERRCNCVKYSLKATRYGCMILMDSIIYGLY